MTPADPAGGVSRVSHPFPLAEKGATTHAPLPLHATARAFVLHLSAAERGLPLRQGTTMPQPAGDPRAALRTASHEFEAAFLRQMLTAMRASVPHEDLTGANNPGEDMYTSMLDDRLASVAATRSHGGLGDAMYRQLATHLLPESGAATGSDR